MTTQLDDIAEQLEAVRLNGRIKRFAEQQHEDAGYPETIHNYKPVLDDIDTTLGLIETVEANTDEEYLWKRLREQTGRLREHARVRYGNGVVPTALNEVGAALTAWENGDDVDTEAVRHNLQKIRAATQTLQDAHEWLASEKKTVELV